METIYLNPATYHCSRVFSEDAIAFETAFFSGKCDAFVEGYYIVPGGYTLEMENGEILKGEMIAPWKDFARLDTQQRQFEREKIAQYEALINELYEEAVA